MTNNYPHENSLSPWPCTKIGVHDYYRRIGIVFYAQWRRHWTSQGCKAELLGLERFDHPEWDEEFRRVRAAWRGTSLEVWLEPHPILAPLRQKESLESR